MVENPKVQEFVTIGPEIPIFSQFLLKICNVMCNILMPFCNCFNDCNCNAMGHFCPKVSLSGNVYSQDKNYKKSSYI